MHFGFYETRDGKELVDQELVSIEPKKLREQVAHKIVYYENKTFQDLCRGDLLDKIKGTDLWELKFRTSPPHRGLCCLIDLSSLQILHVFKKNYDGPIKNNSIKIALSRLVEFRSRN